MKQLINFNQNDDEVNYLLFCLNDKKYAIDVAHVLEILKLPELDYPQKLPSHLCGLLNYNHMTINVVDVNCILDLEQRHYTVDNQLLILKTEESIFGIIVDKVFDLISISPKDIHQRPYNSQNNVIKFISYVDNEMVFIFDLYSTEKYIKSNENNYSDADITSYFPQDEFSKQVLEKRKNALAAKANYISPKIFLDVNEFVWFTLGKNNFCLSIEHIKEIVNTEKNVVTPVPCTPDYIGGIMTLRGDFFTVLDMNKFLEIYDNYAGAGGYNKIIVINSNEFKIAFLVNAVNDILTLSPEDYGEPASDKGESKYVSSEFIRNHELFRVLNIKKILQDNKLFIKESV